MPEEELATQMKREDMRENLWKLMRGWGDRRLLDYFVHNLPLHITEEMQQELEKMSEEELTPREALTEGRRRGDFKVRLENAVGEEQLNMDRDRLIQEMALEMQLPALEEFCAHLDNSGVEQIKTWRSKLVSVTIGKHPDKGITKPVIFAYFKADINEAELESLHKAYLRKTDFDYEVNIPEGYHWRLRTDLEEYDDAVAHNAGWTRYCVGDVT
jgi:hypothetical protein